MASHVLGGMSPFSLRLPNALIATALVLLTAWVASRWYDERAALWAGFALLTSHQFAFEAIGYRPDLAFTLAIAGAFWLYIAAFSEGKVRWGPRIAAFALLGLAILSKGPLGLLLPGLVLVLWHGSRREWRRILELAPLALVALAVALPWYVACGLAMGPESMYDELWGQNAQRFAGTATNRGHEQPFTYYLTGIWADMFPWAFLLPFAIWWTVKSGRARDPRVQLTLWWFGTFFVFLSIAVTKRQVYMLPAYPAAALLLGPWLARVGRTDGSDPEPDPEAGSTDRADLPPDRRVVRVWAGIVGMLMLILGIASVAGSVFNENLIERIELDQLQLQVALALRRPLAALALLTLAAVGWITVAWWRNDTRGMLRRVSTTLVAAYILIGLWAMPAFEPVKTYRPQSEWIASQLEPDVPFGLVNPRRGYGIRKMGAFGYYSGHHVEVMTTRAEIADFFRRHPTSLVLVVDEAAPEMLGEDPSRWKPRVVRKLQTGRFVYHVVKAPPGGAPRPGA